MTWSTTKKRTKKKPAVGVCVFVQRAQQNGKTVIRAVEPASRCVVDRPYDDDADLFGQFEDAVLIALEESGVKFNRPLLSAMIPSWRGTFDIGFDYVFVVVEH